MHNNSIIGYMGDAIVEGCLSGPEINTGGIDWMTANYLPCQNKLSCIVILSARVRHCFVAYNSLVITASSDSSLLRSARTVSRSAVQHRCIVI